MTNTPFNDLQAGNTLVELQVQDDFSGVIKSFEPNQRVITSNKLSDLVDEVVGLNEIIRVMGE